MEKSRSQSQRPCQSPHIPRRRITRILRQVSPQLPLQNIHRPASPNSTLMGNPRHTIPDPQCSRKRDLQASPFPRRRLFSNRSITLLSRKGWQSLPPVNFSVTSVEYAVVEAAKRREECSPARDPSFVVGREHGCGFRMEFVDEYRVGRWFLTHSIRWGGSGVSAVGYNYVGVFFGSDQAN